MPDELSPATVTEAPIDDAVQTPAAETAQATETAPVAAPQATEPDYDSLLNNEDVVNRLLSHPKAQQRIKSVRQADIERQAEERAAAKAEALLRQRDAVYANQHQREERLRDIQEELRLLDDDPTHPVAQRRRPALERELATIRDTEAKERAASELRPNIEQQAIQAANHHFISAIGQHLAESGAFSEQELGEISPFAERYVNLGPQAGFKAWLADVFGSMTKKQATVLAEKLVKEKLPSEVEAGVQARLGSDRSKTPAPATLPQGGASNTDDEFHADYGAGKSNDTARQLRWMRDNGIVI